MASDKIKWTKLRKDFFRDCTDHRPNLKVLNKVNIAPHDLFEWFKKRVETELKE